MILRWGQHFLEQMIANSFPCIFHTCEQGQNALIAQLGFYLIIIWFHRELLADVDNDIALH